MMSLRGILSNTKYMLGEARRRLKPDAFGVFEINGHSRVIFAGSKPAANEIKNLLFPDETPVRELASCRGFSQNETLSETSAHSADILIKEIAPWQTEHTDSEFLFQLTVDALIPVEGSADAYLATLNKQLRRTVKQGQDLGGVIRISASKEDLKHFYETMMVPLGKARHGGKNWLPPLSDFEAVFEHLVLVLLEIGGKPMAGEIYLKTSSQSKITEWRFGIAEEKVEDAKFLNLTNTLLTYEFIRYGLQHGYRNISMGQVMSVFNNGIYRYKRKWGCRFESLGQYPNYTIEFTNQAALARTLKAKPLLVKKQNGLQALCVFDDATPEGVTKFKDLLSGSLFDGLSLRVYTTAVHLDLVREICGLYSNPYEIILLSSDH